VIGIALMRHAPDLKTFALCDGNHEPHNTIRYLREVGILGRDEAPAPERLAPADIRIAGVNHCTWLLKFTYEGRDMMPRLREVVAERAARELAEGGGGTHSKRRYNNAYALALLDLYGAYPTAVGHTKEYVPFWQGYGSAQGLAQGLPPITPFDAEERQRHTEGVWREIEEYVSGARPIGEFLRSTRADHAGDIIEAMWAGWEKPFYLNGPNQGAVSNLPDDAFLELKRMSR
jgi:Alpha-galactosidases/6-phospho-beta-glucosidases, family 4 of glycosyl hydrolases